jgi:hypothetical protein
MSRIAWALKNAANKTSAKGAAITLTSTVASCALACYIEIGAHRLVYYYFPHKYANIQHANGITQEQLDAVRIYKTNNTTGEPVNVLTSKAHEDIKELSRESIFWKDSSPQAEDFLACAMTG